MSVIKLAAAGRIIIKVFKDFSRQRLLVEKEKIEQVIHRLLAEIEEEDVGVSLLSTFSRGSAELSFFKESDRLSVLQILEKLSEDSQRHKEILMKLVACLGRRRHGK